MLGTILVGFCILKMIPYGLAGDAHKVLQWFIAMAISFVIAAPFGVAYYYYLNYPKDARNDETEVNILASVDGDLKKSKNPRK